MPSPALEPTRALAAKPGRIGPWLDLAASQAAWWWCILGARSNHPQLALLGPVAYLLGHVVLARQARAEVLGLIAAGSLAGLVGDGVLARAGLLVFPAGLTLGPAAPFMVSLWAMFAASLRSSAAFVVRQPLWRAALLGAAAGPLAYAGGERLSVLTLPAGAGFAVAFEWALAVPVLVWCARVGERQAHE